MFCDEVLKVEVAVGDTALLMYKCRVVPLEMEEVWRECHPKIKIKRKGELQTMLGACLRQARYCCVWKG